MDFGVLVDVALGILAVVILFSLGASAINEFVADNIMRLRGRTLARGIEQLLAKRTGLEGAALGELVEDFYRDASIRALMEGGRRPSAIEPWRYALTALKLLNERDAAKAEARDRFAAARRELASVVRETARNLGAPEGGAEINRRLDVALDRAAAAGATAAQELDVMLATLEAEFNEAMDRVSGWYLRRTKINLFVIGLLLAVGANVDLLRYADRMMTQDALNERVETVQSLFGDTQFQQAFAGYVGSNAAAEASETEETVASDDDAEDLFGLGRLNDQIGMIVGSLDDLDVQIGWECTRLGSDEPTLPLVRRFCDTPGTGLPAPSASQIIGWFLIAFAVTLGAQFWFDLFKRLAHLRTAGITGSVAVAQASRPSG